MPKKVLFVVKSSPYGSVLAAECFRMATALIAMDVLPQILFIDDGVYCLLKEQKPETAGLSSFDERLKTLADLVGLYVEEYSLHKRNLGKADLDENYNLKIISKEEATSLFLENETVMTF
jgi:tRNA 2-thiouridine synthesizing protein C